MQLHQQASSQSQSFRTSEGPRTPHEPRFNSPDNSIQRGDCSISLCRIVLFPDDPSNIRSKDDGKALIVTILRQTYKQNQFSVSKFLYIKVVSLLVSICDIAGVDGSARLTQYIYLIDSLPFFLVPSTLAMSDTEQDLLVALDATIEAHELEKVLAVFDSAAKEAKQTGDFLSYSTILDMYLSEPERFRFEERDQLLGHLLKILEKDHALVYEIGWDLPALLLPFLESDYQFNGSLREAPCVYRVLKLFEVLARHGNPKELFLKGTELLSTLLEKDATTDDAYRQKKFYDVKLYCLFELIDSCLRRIHTLYPSRFLGMTVASFINSLYVNPIHSVDEMDFRWKRVYSFARNYHRPPLPEKIEISPEELEKINEDEDFLQRKLLTGFVTEAVSMATKNALIGYSTDLFNHILRLYKTAPLNNFSIELPVLDRLYELALSFDIDITGTFKRFLSDSRSLIDALELEGDFDDDKHGHLFEKLLVSYQKDVATALVANDAKTVQDSIAGILILFTHSVGPSRNLKKVRVTIEDAVALTLRLVVPGMVHDSYVHHTLGDIAVFWSWYSVVQGSTEKLNLALEISKIPKLLLQAYFQALLFILISSRTMPNLRFVTLTLLTKLLAYAPEDTSYDFLMDSFKNCPYENLKTALVGVFKELTTKEKADVDCLTTKLSESSIESSGGPPPLPKRNSSKKTSFITLTESRVDELLDIIQQSTERTLVAIDKATKINEESFSTLVALLNLLILLKARNLVTKEDVTNVTAQVRKKVQNVEENLHQDESGATAVNFAGILNVTLDRLSA